MIIRLVLLAALALAGGCASGRGAGDKMYMCPMHTEVTSANPGKCAKCGMMLSAAQPATQPANQPAKGAHQH